MKLTNKSLKSNLLDIVTIGDHYILSFISLVLLINGVRMKVVTDDFTLFVRLKILFIVPLNRIIIHINEKSNIGYNKLFYRFSRNILPQISIYFHSLKIPVNNIGVYARLSSFANH